MIQWVESEDHGRHPCSDGNELQMFLKAGWREIGPPPWDKPKTEESTCEKLVEEIVDRPRRGRSKKVCDADK